QAACLHLAEDAGFGIRLLRQCESRGGSSPLVPGNRASDRWRTVRRAAGNTEVQRLWRAGCPALCRDGFGEELLMKRRFNDFLRRLPVWAVWLAGLLPLALLIFDTFAGNLGIDPVRDIEHRLGRTALYFLIGGLAVTPLLRITGISLMKFRRAIGLLCFTY